MGAPFVGSFLRDIGSFNLGVAGANNNIGDNIGGIEKTGGNPPAQDALGIDYNNDGQGLGYTIPSLLGIEASPPFYHNGACETLSCVVGNVKHRTADPNPAAPVQPQADRLQSAADREKVVTFLRSID